MYEEKCTCEIVATSVVCPVCRANPNKVGSCDNCGQTGLVPDSKLVVDPNCPIHGDMVS